MRELSLAECEALAERWEQRNDAAYREFCRTQDQATLFADCSPQQLIQIWKSGRNLKGRKLNDFEFGALCEAWVVVFDSLPPADDGAEHSNAPTITRPQPDTMLNMHDVCRLTGLSESTIKRMVIDGRFPAPLKLSPRRNGWLAQTVTEWRDTRPA